MNELVGFLIVFGILLFYVGVIGVCVADYIMSSLGLYRLASRRGISKPWLAWIPVANAWTVGAIVDEYDETLGFNRKWRYALLALSIIVVGGIILAYSVMLGFIFSQMDNMNTNTMNVEAFFAVFISAYILLLAAALCAMALIACQMVCLFKIYESTVPEKALKYLLLSMLVPLAEAICLLKCSEKGYDNLWAEDAERLSLFDDELPEVEIEITVEEADEEE